MAPRRTMRQDFPTTARGSCTAKGCIRCHDFLAMKTLQRFHLPALAGFALAVAATPLFADGPYRSRDNPNPQRDSAEGTYPVPYQLPTVPEVTEVLGRIR